ncbi:hypothetical protein YC2023_064743 [Brassica napus]
MSANKRFHLISDLKPFKEVWHVQVKLIHSWIQNPPYADETLEMALADQTNSSSGRGNNFGTSRNFPTVYIYKRQRYNEKHIKSLNITLRDGVVSNLCLDPKAVALEKETPQFLNGEVTGPLWELIRTKHGPPQDTVRRRQKSFDVVVSQRSGYR